jgi:hypothetical protein
MKNIIEIINYIMLITFYVVDNSLEFFSKTISEAKQPNTNIKGYKFNILKFIFPSKSDACPLVLEKLISVNL